MEKEAGKWEERQAGRDYSKIPLDTCPWCGAKLAHYNARGRVRFFCSNEHCTFNIGTRELPVRLCDDDVYRCPPTLLLGTVDKFAQLARKAATGRTMMTMQMRLASAVFVHRALYERDTSTCPLLLATLARHTDETLTDNQSAHNLTPEKAKTIKAMLESMLICRRARLARHHQVGRHDNKTGAKHKDDKLKDKDVYALLKPVPIVLICPNGHISDLPWDKYFCARLAGMTVDSDQGFDLFAVDAATCPKSPSHQHSLLWLVNRNTGETWGTLKCKHCKQTVSLAGVMNVRPLCPGHRPWERGGHDDNCRSQGKRTVMRAALTTSNAIYYANCLSSLYVPEKYTDAAAGNLTTAAARMLKKITDKIYPNHVRRHPGATKEDFWQERFADNSRLTEYAEDDDLTLTDTDCGAIKSAFLGDGISGSGDILADYRLEEYRVFASNKSTPGTEPGLSFADIELPPALRPYFTKIQRVDTLAVTTTQLGFSRVSMPQPRCMGGLVWQAQPQLIERTIRSAVARAAACASDPMCWENVSGLNRAACFSCAMVAETSCEQRNLGLDRRALADPEYGFFRNLNRQTAMTAE